MKNFITKQLYLNTYNFPVIYILLFIYLMEVVNVLQVFFNVNMPIARYLLASIAIFYLIKSITKNYTDTYKWNNSVFLNNLIWIFIIINLYVIIFALPDLFSPSNNFINLKLFISGQFLLFLFPMILLLRPDILLYKSLFRLAFFLSYFYLIITILWFKDFAFNISNSGEHYGRILASSSFILLLTFPYHSLKVNIVASTSIILALIINAFLARRNQVVSFFVILSFAMFTLFFAKTIARNVKILYLVVIGLILIFIIVFLYSSIFSNFSFLFDRFDEGFSSRETVIDEFNFDFNNHPNDWIWGRGMNGSYLSESIYDNIENGSRTLIENGYYQAILNGGLVYLFFYVFLMLNAIFLGLFRSNNLLVKACAFILITQLVEMFGYGLPQLSFKYFFIFLAISTCFSKEIRRFSDKQIKPLIGI